MHVFLMDETCISVHRSWATGTNQMSTLSAPSSSQLQTEPPARLVGILTLQLEHPVLSVGSSWGWGQSLVTEGGFATDFSPHSFQSNGQRFTSVHKETYTTVCTAALLTTGKNWKQPKCPSVGEYFK